MTNDINDVNDINTTIKCKKLFGTVFIIILSVFIIVIFLKLLKLY